MTYDRKDIVLEDDEIRFTPQGRELFESCINSSDKYEAAPVYENGEISSILIEDKSEEVIYRLEEPDQEVVDDRISLNYEKLQDPAEEIVEALEEGSRGSFPISTEKVPETHNMTEGEPSDGSEIMNAS